MEQLDMFSTTLTEQMVYETLIEPLQSVIQDNNANKEKLIFKQQKSYSSIWFATQLAFRICCRNGHHYFGISNMYASCADESVLSSITTDGASDGFTNFSFQPNTDSILLFEKLLCDVLSKAIDSMPKEFDCCSQFEECSNAKMCIQPNPDIAVACGYRKILKQGRIFYGKNRNID